MPSRLNPRPPRVRRQPGPLMPGGFLLLGLILIAILAAALLPFGSSPAVPYDEFINLMNAKAVQKIELVGNDRVFAELRDEFKKANPTVLKQLRIPQGRFTTRLVPAPDRRDLYTMARRLDVQFDARDEHGNWFGVGFTWALVTFLALLLLLSFLLPRFRDPLSGGMTGPFGKSPARRYDKAARNRVTFADVADMESAKRELAEVVDFLRSPDKFLKLGAQIPKGVLLVGPPGTGKTLLARAVAGEANASFFSINGAEFIQMFVGVGASRVRDLFRTAKDSAPCLIFIDEIDAVGRMRGTGVGGGSDEREQTLNQILGEMDGFTPADAVIVIAATNRPDVLDVALLRPGRFDRHITIDRPTWQGRLDILKVHTRNKPLADDVDLEAIARSSVGMTGADLRNLANEAALLAARTDKTRIDRTDFNRAMDRVLLGPQREEVLSPADKRRTAYHEAGHALVAMLEPEADKPHRVSIIPRGRTLGVNQITPDEHRYHHGFGFFRARLAMFMGGRAADRLVYDEPFAGAEQDLREASRLARYMVTHWGMSERLGPVSFRVGEEHLFLGKEIQEPRDFSEGTARVIDEEVSKLLREADTRAFELVRDHRPALERIVEALMVNEELDRASLEAAIAGRDSVHANGVARPEAAAPAAVS